jgi:hypothetical protein
MAKYKYIQDLGFEIQLQLSDSTTGTPLETFSTSQVNKANGTFKGEPIMDFPPDLLDSQSTTAVSYQYEVQEQGPKHTVVVYEISNIGQKEIYRGTPSSSSTDEVLKQEALQALSASYPGVTSMTLRPSSTSTPTYQYSIKTLGPRKYIVVSQISNTGEKEIFTGEYVDSNTSEEALKKEAIQALTGTYTGVSGMTQKTPPPPAPSTAPPVTPPPTPLPDNLQTTEPPKYLPQSKYKKPEKARLGQFIVKGTKKPYQGYYIETYKKQFFAGETPEQNGVELERAPEKYSLPDLGNLLSIGLSLVALLQSAFKKKISQDEIDKGIAKRYFVQDNRTLKVSETSEELYEQGKKELPDFLFAEVPWHINSPAEDMVINGMKFQGSESRNKETINKLDEKMPGIVNFVTDYKYLVKPTPIPITSDQVKNQVQTIKDPFAGQVDFRKARFDQRNSEDMM